MDDLTGVDILIIEDSDDDAVLICEELRRGGYRPAFDRVETAEALRQAISDKEYDIVISDYSLPQFNALEALKIVNASGKDIPFIVVSGSVRESIIVDVMRAGARDYVMKDNLTRLPLAVQRELLEAAERKGRRQFDEQLRHTQRLESLGVLAGGVAHDFNNLLTGIIGNVSLAIEELQSAPHITSMLESALQAGEQAANLTRQMLAYAGKGKFVIEPLDLSAATRNISALLTASVSKNIHLLFELKDGLPPVEADRGQIQQILMNLVVNAAEAIGPDRSGTILIATESCRLTERDLGNLVIWDDLKPGTYPCLEVRDTGSGIEPAMLPRIFDPFFTTKFTGRGLGLSAVMGIVRSHHGAIRVDSQPGKGCTFTVFLPAASSAGPAVEHERAPAVNTLTGVVLVIDDEETVRRTAKMILENRGLHVFVAETGLSGLEAFRRLADRIVLVLLDVTMPTLSGAEVLREIRSLRPDVPVLMSSGYSEADAMRRFQYGDVAGFIQKPYTASELLEKVCSVLRRMETTTKNDGR